jgi:hypothetical protein
MEMYAVLDVRAMRDVYRDLLLGTYFRCTR